MTSVEKAVHKAGCRVVASHFCYSTRMVTLRSSRGMLQQRSEMPGWGWVSMLAVACARAGETCMMIPPRPRVRSNVHLRPFVGPWGPRHGRGTWGMHESPPPVALGRPQNLQRSREAGHCRRVRRVGGAGRKRQLRVLQIDPRPPVLQHHDAPGAR